MLSIVEYGICSDPDSLPNVKCKDYKLLKGPSAGSASAYARCSVTYIAITTFLLLLLAGDIETNPGPTGVYLNFIEYDNCT